MKLCEKLDKINEELLLEYVEDIDIFKSLRISEFNVSKRPDKTKDEMLIYKCHALVGWQLSKENEKKYPDPKELKKPFINDCIKKEKFKNLFKDYVYGLSTLFNKSNKEDRFFKLEINYNDVYDVHYNQNNQFYYAQFTGELQLDLGEWWAESIIKAQTEKSFFFKNYKIKFKYDVIPILRLRTGEWKDICEKMIKWAMFNHTKLKEHMRKLTGLKMDSKKVDFEITFNATQNEIKLVLLRGIIKWLKKFGISGEFAKWIVAGLTIFGVLKLIKKTKEKSDYLDIKKKIQSFLKD